MRLFAIRHGESEGNVDETVYTRKADFKIELTARGRQQADEMRDNLPSVDKIYCSPYMRTRQTMEYLYPDISLRPPVIWEPSLQEHSIGNYRDLKEIEVCRIYSRFFYRFRDGESGADVYERCVNFLHRIRSSDERILLVTHAYTMRVLYAIRYNLHPEEIDHLPKPDNCSIMDLS